MSLKDLHFQRYNEFKSTSKASNNSQKPNEAEIWSKFKSGDEAAFIWMYRNYFSVLYNFARQFDLDEESVKDQIQELFIYIRNNRERLSDIKSIKFYLFKSLRRRLLSNKKKRYSIISLFTPENNKTFEIGISESPEHQLIDQGLQSEINLRLSKSMNRLTARQREAVLHFYYEGLSYKEIAEIMDLKRVKSARKLVYRAIETLRKDLHELKSNIYK